MICKAYGATLRGIEPHIVCVEADFERGLPKFEIVGMAQTSVREGKNRIASALKSTGIEWKAKKIIVSLAPASISKEGTGLDLPIAFALLCGAGVLPQSWVEETLAVGELSLDGTIQRTRGIFPIASLAQVEGKKRIVLPPPCYAEGKLASRVEVLAPKSIFEVISHVRGEHQIQTPHIEKMEEVVQTHLLDWSDVGGQFLAKRALEIAAVGNHNILLSGPPGIGKSLLARRLPTILPPLDDSAYLEILRIQSVMGAKILSIIPREAPFRAPHHHASLAGMVGGGRPFRPGDYTLAHRGVLLMDELPEFRRDVIESLREPIETGTTTATRLEETFRLPAQFLFVGTMNLCPCGMLGDPRQSCLCTPLQIHNYQKKVSGPVRDRIDLWVSMTKPSAKEVFGTSDGERSCVVQERVEAARRAQMIRGQSDLNGKLSFSELRHWTPLSGECEKLLSQALDRFNLSARGVSKTLSVARTIADMEGVYAVGSQHISEALTYRGEKLGAIRTY